MLRLEENTKQGGLNRKKARKQAFVLLFEKSFRPDESLSDLMEWAEETGELIPDSFTQRLAEGTLLHLPEIDQRIAEKSIGWKMERISRTALTAMRLCCYELFYEDAIPPGVSINEAVELAKAFGTPEDAAFLNGVLGSIVRSYLPGAESGQAVPPEPESEEIPADADTPDTGE